MTPYTHCKDNPLSTLGDEREGPWDAENGRVRRPQEQEQCKRGTQNVCRSRSGSEASAVSAQLFARRSSLNAEWPTHCNLSTLIFTVYGKGDSVVPKGKAHCFQKTKGTHMKLVSLSRSSTHDDTLHRLSLAPAKRACHPHAPYGTRAHLVRRRSINSLIIHSPQSHA